MDILKITSLLIIVALFNERKAFVIFRPKSARTILNFEIKIWLQNVNIVKTIKLNFY